jgi:sulfur carrier protein
MIIWVNQQPQEVVSPISLLQLMKQLNKAEQKGIAVALHQKVIPKERWDRTNLKEEDKITIITATQGG